MVNVVCLFVSDACFCWWLRLDGGIAMQKSISNRQTAYRNNFEHHMAAHEAHAVCTPFVLCTRSDTKIYTHVPYIAFARRVVGDVKRWCWHCFLMRHSVKPQKRIIPHSSSAQHSIVDDHVVGACILCERVFGLKIGGLDHPQYTRPVSPVHEELCDSVCVWVLREQHDMMGGCLRTVIVLGVTAAAAAASSLRRAFGLEARMGCRGRAPESGSKRELYDWCRVIVIYVYLCRIILCEKSSEKRILCH